MLNVEFKTFEIEDKNNIYFEYINVNKDGEEYFENEEEITKSINNFLKSKNIEYGEEYSYQLEMDDRFNITKAQNKNGYQVKTLLNVRHELYGKMMSYEKEGKTVWIRVNIDMETKLSGLLHRAMKKYNEEEDFNINEYILKAITKLQNKYGINQTDDLKDYCKNFNPEDIIGNNKGRGKDKREKRNKYLSKEEKQALEDEKESKRSYRYYPA